MGGNYPQWHILGSVADYNMSKRGSRWMLRWKDESCLPSWVSFILQFFIIFKSLNFLNLQACPYWLIWGFTAYFNFLIWKAFRVLLFLVDFIMFLILNFWIGIQMFSDLWFHLLFLFAIVACLLLVPRGRGFALRGQIGWITRRWCMVLQNDIGVTHCI